MPVTEFVGTFYLTLTATLTGSPIAVGAMLVAMVYMGDHVCGGEKGRGEEEGGVGAMLWWMRPASQPTPLPASCLPPQRTTTPRYPWASRCAWPCRGATCGRSA